MYRWSWLRGGLRHGRDMRACLRLFTVVRVMRCCACATLFCCCYVPTKCQLYIVVTKRRNSWTCRDNPNPEQETINYACKTRFLFDTAHSSTTRAVNWEQDAAVLDQQHLSAAFHFCSVTVTKRRNSWACRGNPNPEQEAEAIRTQSRKPSKAHTHKKRQPTNAGQPHSTWRKEATPQLGAAHAASEDNTHTSNHTACHQGRNCRPARHPPRAQQVPSQHTHN